MTLTALIGAYHESSDPGDGLRATLNLAGRTLIERQALLAADAGARTILVVVERQPPELVRAIERLRAGGIDILVARNAGEAAKAVQAITRILLVADGLIADAAQVRAVADQENLALLAVPDLRFDDRFERIDAESRWGGLALIDGQTLKHTAAMLQDWDLQSTLLRRVVQSGARHIGISGDPADARLIVAERAGDLAALEGEIVDRASAFQGDWVSRYLLAPLEQVANRRLLPTAATPDQLWLGALLLACLAAFAFSRGWLWTGLGLFLAATPIDGIGERLARLRMQAGGGWLRRLFPLGGGAALLALGYALGTGTSLVLAAAAIAFAIALHEEARGASVPGRIFLADAKGMGWLLLPFAAAGQWRAGLAVLALYAAGSFFWAQRHVHRGRPQA